MIKINRVKEKQVIVMLGESEAEIVEQMMFVAMENNDWCIAKAARSLGLTRTCLSVRLRKLNIREKYACHALEAIQAE